MLNAEAVAAGGRRTSTSSASPRTRARRSCGAQEADDGEELRHHEEMEQLYRQHVLKEQPTLQIQGLGAGRRKQEVAEVVHKPTV